MDGTGYVDVEGEGAWCLSHQAVLGNLDKEGLFWVPEENRKAYKSGMEAIDILGEAYGRDALEQLEKEGCTHAWRSGSLTLEMELPYEEEPNRKVFHAGLFVARQEKKVPELKRVLGGRPVYTDGRIVVKYWF